jgi:hypothetical protein
MGIEEIDYSEIKIDKPMAERLKNQGWLFDWSKYRNQPLIKLTVSASDDIQGLITYHDDKGFTFVDLVESAPHNRGLNKKYKNVGLRLFAIAAQHSLKVGNEGFISCKPKTKLYEHYIKMLGALPLPNGNLYLNTEASTKLVKKYIKKVGR